MPVSEAGREYGSGVVFKGIVILLMFFASMIISPFLFLILYMSNFLFLFGYFIEVSITDSTLL